MPRPSKPSRLWLEPSRPGKRGEPARPAVWVILHRGKKRSTGCGEFDIVGAQKALGDYVAEIHNEGRRERVEEKTAAQVPIADVIAAYAEHKTDTSPNATVRAVARPKELIARLERLLAWWGDRTLADINRHTCQQYARHRGSLSAARRELEDLKAAIKLAADDGRCRQRVEITMPEKSPPRMHFFTRDQVAALIWHCYRHQVEWTPPRGPNAGKKTKIKKHTLRHLIPFILTATYTASRSARIWNASFEKEPGRPWLDLEKGIFHRMWQGEVATTKRAATIRLPARLLAHMHRWQRGPLIDGVRVPRRYLVEWKGQPADPRLALARSMDEVFGKDHPFVRHTFRHTAITWLMWAGVDISDVSDFASVSEKILISVYSHQHPDTHKNVGDAFSSGRAGKSRDAQKRSPRTIAKETPVNGGETRELEEAES